jgi:hypothetical protein
MQTDVKRHPRFWRLDCGQAAQSDLFVDDTEFCGDSPSCFFRFEDEEIEHSGYMVQTMGAIGYRGKRIKFSAKVKIKSLAGKAALFLKVLDAGPETILDDFMLNRELEHATEWTELNIVIDIPPEARYINFGVFIQGSGALWVGELAICEVGHDVAITESGSRNTLHTEPVNLNLAATASDTDLPQGWKFHAREADFKGALSEEDGRRALSITSSAAMIPLAGEKSSSSGKFSQLFGCTRWRNRKVRFSADIKCKNVGDWTGLMMWVTGVNGKVLRFTTMYEIGPGGDTDWQNYAVVLDVPATGCNIILAAVLNGNGEALFSNLNFDVAGDDEQTTDQRTGPKNLSFADCYDLR